MLRSLICQLADRSLKSFNILNSLYERKYKQGNAALYITPTELSVQELLQTLQEMIQGYRRIYVVMDGLDECAERNRVLESIRKLIEETSGIISLLVVSQLTRDIERHLEKLGSSMICCNEASISQDIRAYLHNELEHDVPFIDWPDDTRKEVEEKLVRGADGM